MNLLQEAQQIQEYLDIECSENPEEVLERIRAIMAYISRTAFMLAEAKKALRRKKASEISNTIINIAKEQCLSAKVQNTLIDSIAEEEAYLAGSSQRCCNSSGRCFTLYTMIRKRTIKNQ